MKILGIDPGMTGAAAILDTAAEVGPRLVDAIDLPTMGEKAQREIDVVTLAEWIMGHRPDRAVIENVQPMPSQALSRGEQRRSMGAASAFRFGAGVFAVRAVVRLQRIPLTLVVPTVWKKIFGLKGGDKEPSRLYAINEWPDRANHLFARKMDQQRAEAALIALWFLQARLNAPQAKGAALAPPDDKFL